MSETYSLNYDDVPYPVLSHSDTHPGRHEVIAILLGMQPVPVTRCRVLEIGCASGGNLIPMAEALPESTFVGIDSSQGQINQARKTIEALQLSNITCDALDIMDITADFGQFDYIIAHGIYSWVPEPVRDKLVAICKHNLTPQGIAYISYNTQPGWYMLQMIREMMKWHTRNAQTPQQQMREAYDLIKFLVGSIDRDGRNETYATYLDKYLATRFSYEDGEAILDTSLLHDELEAINQPVFFHEFMAHTGKYGLQYMSEIPFMQVMLRDIPAAAMQTMGKYATNLTELEQYADFVRNRTFRRSLLCHDGITIERKLKPHVMDKFYIAMQAMLVENPDSPPPTQHFLANDGTILSTDHLVSTAALNYLIENYPQVTHFNELFNIAAARSGGATEQDKLLLAANILQGFTSSSSMIQLLTYDPGLVTHVSQQPVARPVARWDAQHHPTRITTTLHHTRASLDPFARYLVPYLDGTHDREALHGLIVAQLASGAITVEDKEGAPIPDDKVHIFVTRQIEETLNWLASSAILIG